MDGSSFSLNEARQAQSVNMGRITSIRNVQIPGGNTAGTVIGGVAGGALGSNIGGGSTPNF